MGERLKKTKQEVERSPPEERVRPRYISMWEEEEEDVPYPTVAPVVLFGLKQTTTLRNWCLKMTFGPWLDFVSILVIILHCVSLSWSMYMPGEKSLIVVVLETFVFVFFVMELLLKTVALGLFGSEGSYLRNNWNKFDAVILFGEVVDYFLSNLGVHVQFCRAFSPMRLISRERSMRELATKLLHMVPMIANALLLFVFVIFIFSVIGVQLWAGELRNRCFLGEDINENFKLSLSPYFISAYGEKGPFFCSRDDSNWAQHCKDVPAFIRGEQTCSQPAPHSADGLVPANACVNWNVFYNVCRAGEHNPERGAINFDNIGYAMVAIFQVVTLEGWTDIMYYVMDAYSFWSFVFFILVTILGSFIMMNVCGVVIATKFLDSIKRDTGERRASIVTQLCRRLICCLRTMSDRYSRVHPVERGYGTGGPRTLAWMPVKAKLERAVKSKLFDRLIMCVVLLSVFTIAIEHNEQPKVLTHTLRITNITCTLIFVVEMVVKLLALSWAYFMDGKNIFDFAIVIVSIWELIVKADGRLSVLRAFRVLRFVRLLHFLPYLKRQLLVLKRTMLEGGSLCKLMLFTLFIFSVLGTQLFRGKFSFQTQTGLNVTGRKNFDSFRWSMVTVFQILTVEDWNLVLYNGMAATSPWAALYFIVLIVLGKYVLLNVLVGIVVESFQAGRSSSSERDSVSFTPPVADNETNVSSRATPDRSLSPRGPGGCTVIDSAPTDTNKDNRSLNGMWRVLRWCRQHNDWSLYVLSPQNRFRVFCQRVISHRMFDHVILGFILLSCVTIVVERPGIDPNSTERWILKASSYVFSAVFLVEMLFKVLALGLLFGKDSYSRSLWNVMDGFLVMMSLVHVFISLASTDKDNMLGILKVLRLLRTLRALRVIKRAPKLKLAVEALIVSVKPIGNIALICSIFFLFYGILGVQLFKGKFYHCVGQDIRNITNKTDCLSANYQWERKAYNFDSLPQALLALFAMFSKDGWVNIMYDGLDAVKVDQQPVRNYNEWMLLYFISFMIMSLFLLDMFIGVMVETFQQCQQEQRSRGEREEAGRASQDRGPEQAPYYANYSPLRRSVHAVCTSKHLELAMTLIIFMSVLLMALEHYLQPPHIEMLMEYSHYVFTVIVIIEALLKVVAFGVLRFMKDRWNVVDVLVVFVSIVGIFLDQMEMADVIAINPSILRVCRVLRLTRVLKAKVIQVLLKTIIKTLSQVGNICLLFVFFFFIYAALGVELFGKLECSGDHPCLGLHRHSNFRHFGMALLTLFKVCTGDNWSGVFRDTLRQCRPGDVGCSRILSWVSPIYFTSFVVMAQFVLVNLVVATIMQALEDSVEEENMQAVDQALPTPEDGSAGTSEQHAE